MAINLEEGSIFGTNDDHPKGIDRWEVWFLVPMSGVFKDRVEAIKICKDLDWSPNEVIIPVPVAISHDETYEVRI